MIEILYSLLGVFSSLPTSLLVFLLMFLAAFILPIPSETVSVVLGVKVDLATLIIYGSAGATTGSLITYFLGRYFGKYLRKYGHLFFIRKKTLDKIEKFIRKHEKNAILWGRALPIIPHKLVSLAAGIFKINLKDFLVFSFVGMIIRLLIFFYSGKILSLNMTAGLITLILIGVVSLIVRKRL